MTQYVMHWGMQYVMQYAMHHVIGKLTEMLGSGDAPPAHRVGDAPPAAAVT